MHTCLLLNHMISFIMWPPAPYLIRFCWFTSLASSFWLCVLIWRRRQEEGQHLSYSTILPHSFLWHIEVKHWLCFFSYKKIKQSSFFRYCRFLARYSGLVLVSISTLSVIAIICSLTLHQLPDFTDPQAVSDRYQKHFIFISKVESPQTLTKFNLPPFFSFAVFLYILQLLHYNCNITDFLLRDTYHSNPLF